VGIDLKLFDFLEENEKTTMDCDTLARKTGADLTLMSMDVP